MSRTPVVVITKVSGIVQDDWHTTFRRQYPYMAARKIMVVFQRRPFRILIANVSGLVISLGNHQQVAILRTPLLESSHNKNDESSSYSVLQPLSDLVNVVHYNSATDRLKQEL